MRLAPLCLALALATLAGCSTKSNDAVCCVTEADCARLGLDDLRFCDVGQACRDFRCVAAECTTAADCTDPAAPACALGLCVASCTADADCTGAASGPHCAPDGACVGCVTEIDCGGDTPYCDGATRSCRGCAADAECGSGVCIEADGACVDDLTAVIFVREDGLDAGDCSRAAPCKSLPYALTRVNSARSVVYLMSEFLDVPETLTLTTNVILDGTGTRLKPSGSGSGAKLELREGRFLMERVALGEDVDVQASATLRLFDARLTGHTVQVGAAGLELRAVEIADALVDCAGGRLAVLSSHLEASQIRYSNCQVSVERSRFAPVSDGAVSGGGGLLTIANNLFITSSEYTDLLQAGVQAPGSTIAFNTFVNTSQFVDSAQAVQCDASVEVTSNIFAYQSSLPITGCAARYSLFERAAASSVPAAVGNQVGERSDFFRSLASGDYHPGPLSPALGAGQAGVVMVDLEGVRRSATPDIGALEHQ